MLVKEFLVLQINDPSFHFLYIYTNANKIGCDATRLSSLIAQPTILNRGKQERPIPCCPARFMHQQTAAHPWLRIAGMLFASSASRFSTLFFSHLILIYFMETISAYVYHEYVHYVEKPKANGEQTPTQTCLLNSSLTDIYHNYFFFVQRLIQ